MSAPMPLRPSLGIHRQNEFNLVCSQMSVSLFDDAKKNETLPSMHLWVGIKTTVIEAFSLVGRILELAINLIAIIVIPFSAVSNKKEEVLYVASCLFVLSPLNILSGVAISVVRIASSFLGCFSSKVAVEGWKVAEQIEMFNLNLKVSLWKKLVPANDPMTEELALRPENAIRYLGEEVCLALVKRLKNPEEVEMLQSEIQDKLADFLSYVLKIKPDAIEGALHTDAEKGSGAALNRRRQINAILFKIKDFSAAGACFSRDAVKTLTSEEAQNLFTYVTNHLQSKNADGLMEGLSNVVQFTIEAQKDFPDYTPKTTELERLFKMTGFGCVIVPKC